MQLSIIPGQARDLKHIESEQFFLREIEKWFMLILGLHKYAPVPTLLVAPFEDP